MTARDPAPREALPWMNTAADWIRNHQPMSANAIADCIAKHAPAPPKAAPGAAEVARDMEVKADVLLSSVPFSGQEPWASDLRAFAARVRALPGPGAAVDVDKLADSIVRALKPTAYVGGDVYTEKRMTVADILRAALASPPPVSEQARA